MSYIHIKVNVLRNSLSFRRIKAVLLRLYKSILKTWFLFPFLCLKTSTQTYIIYTVALDCQCKQKRSSLQAIFFGDSNKLLNGKKLNQ